MCKMCGVCSPFQPWLLINTCQALLSLEGGDAVCVIVKPQDREVIS